MPNVKGIDLSDGIKIISGEKNTLDAHYNRAALENYLASHSIEQAETAANKFLGNAIKSEQIRVHIFSVSPLRYTCIVANQDVVIPNNWWGE